MHTFPTDPNAPGGPDRSEQLQRDHANRTRRRFRLLSVARTPSDAAGWPPVRQLGPLGSAPRGDRSRSAA
jgi:hypothetical protein